MSHLSSHAHQVFVHPFESCPCEGIAQLFINGGVWKHPIDTRTWTFRAKFSEEKKVREQIFHWRSHFLLAVHPKALYLFELHTVVETIQSFLRLHLPQSSSSQLSGRRLAQPLAQTEKETSHCICQIRWRCSIYAEVNYQRDSDYLGRGAGGSQLRCNAAEIPECMRGAQACRGTRGHGCRKVQRRRCTNLSAYCRVCSLKRKPATPW